MNLLLERNTEELKQDIIIFNLNTSLTSSHYYIDVETLKSRSFIKNSTLRNPFLARVVKKLLSGLFLPSTVAQPLLHSKCCHTIRSCHEQEKARY